MHRVISKREIETWISSGSAIVIYDGLVLNLDKWMKHHPGGDKVILHMVGRDATAEMTSYHSKEAIECFKKWKVGYIDYLWENIKPPIQSVGGWVKKGKLQSETLPSDYEEKHLEKYPSSNGVGYERSLPPPSEINAPGIEKREHPSLSGFPPIMSEYGFMEDVVTDPKVTKEMYKDMQLPSTDNMFPNIDSETQKNILEEYKKLHQEIIDAGLYTPDYFGIMIQFLRFTLLLYSSYHLLYKWNYKLLSAFVLGCTWHQGSFIAHDAGHTAITHNYQLDSIIGMIIASFLGGLSLGWWKHSHNVHHLVTNDPSHDPDIQHLPFFAVSTEFFNNIYSSYYHKTLQFDFLAKHLIPIQHYLYYPILTFGRLNLYLLSWIHILQGLGPRHGKAAWFRYFELCGLIFFNYWYFYLVIFCRLNNNWDRLMFIVVSHVTTMMTHIQITLSHFAMPAFDVSVTESFPQRQLRTSMDIYCPRWLDFFHGGLQFQVIHHLFPRLPRRRLRTAKLYVLRFCKRTGLKYSIYGFAESNNIVLSHLEEIALQARQLLDCAKTIKPEPVDISLKK